MLRTYLISLIILAVFSSCGTTDNTRERDSILRADSIAALYTGKSPAEIEHTNLQLTLPTLRIPDWIDVDSVRNNFTGITPQQSALLFPVHFVIPSDVNVYAFAKHDIDSTTDAIWYRMQKQGSENKDIWVVLYRDSAGPIAVHCPATKGVGYGCAKIDSPNSMREVFADRGEKTTVTTKVVKIEGGKFVTSNETTSAFDSDSTADAKAKLLIEEFFR